MIPAVTQVATSQRRAPTSAEGQRAAPSVSVLIVNYNGGDDLAVCLDALQATDHDSYEVIVVDNGSTDGSADEIASAYPDVHLVKSEENLGFAGGNNLAARHAEGDYLVFLNPDTAVEPGWLRPLIAALDSDPKVGMATPRILLKNAPDRINTCGNAMHITGLTLCRGMSANRDAYPVAEEVDAVSGAAFAMRRSLFEALGGFDPAFFLYMEDTDLSWRTRLAGYTCRYVPSSVVYHDYALRFGPRKTFYQERNRYMMLLKVLRWGTLLIMLPTWVLSEVVTWGFVVSRDRKHFPNKIEAYVWILRHWRELMAQRRVTQALRKVHDRDLLMNTTHRLALLQISHGLVPRLVQAIFDPIFMVLRWATLALVRW